MREEEKRARLQRMRFVALAALLAMLIAFVASSIWQHAIPAFQWLRAFAEAGVAEAIAGSYAVVALFRTSARFAFAAHRDHPGKQGPHRRKRWGFIETNFLTAENVGEKLERLDLAASASESLREPANARNLADALCDLVPPALETVEDAEIRTFVDRGSRTLDDDGHRQGSRSGGPQESPALAAGLDVQQSRCDQDRVRQGLALHPWLSGRLYRQSLCRGHCSPFGRGRGGSRPPDLAGDVF